MHSVETAGYVIESRTRPSAVNGCPGALRRIPSKWLACMMMMMLLLAGLAAAASPATAALAVQGGLAATLLDTQSNPFASRSELTATNPTLDPRTPTRYEQAIIADHPTLYLPLTETGGTTAFDHSGNGLDGTYDLGVTHEDTGPLLDEENDAVYGAGQVVTQSGDKLPSGDASRTIEFWVHDIGTESLTLARYGDIEGGHGFAVTVHQQTLTVEGSGHSVSVPTVDGFGHWCCDGTGWHMVDVTYDGETAEIYQDGQLLGGGLLGNAETQGPGQGLRLNASYGVCCGGAAPYGFAEAAIYPAALTPEQVGAHWSAGASMHEQAVCAPTPSGPYPKSVLEDSPLVYYRLGETATHPKDRVAFDSSGHCYNATFDLGTSGGGGALPGDEDPAIFGSGQAIFQSGDKLPSGTEPRTIESWIHNIGTESLTLARYGDAEGGHGFAVTIHQQILTVEGEAGQSVSAPTIDGFGHWCCDGTGWHMVDVTYDGKTVEIYQDGQLIGGGPFGETQTTVPGQGLRFDTSYGVCCGGAAPYGLDEAAVYASVLSSARIVAHWEAASRAPEGYSVIAGTATNGTGGRVQACPTSGGACVVDRYGIDSSGAFHVVVPDGTYAVTIFPPAGSSDGSKTIGPITVPPSDLKLSAAFTPPGGLPEGASLSSPGRGTQANVVPGLNWEEPFAVHVNGCKGGFGAVDVEATNTSSGVSETRASGLVESEAGSGEYSAQFPPLAPLHGVGDTLAAVVCPGHTSVLPSGGSPSGGTTVAVGGSGFTGATAVSFGSTPASSFKVLQDSVIEAVAPPGVGAELVTVTAANGTTIAAGTYSYYGVTGLSTGSGPSGGGTTVTIHGTGFSDVKGVVFGTMPATSYNVVSPTEVEAVAPPGVGTVDVQVINGVAASDPVAAASFGYQGGPAGSSGIVEGTGPAATVTLADEISNECADSQQYANVGQGQLCNVANFIIDNFGPSGAIQSAVITGILVAAAGAAIYVLAPEVLAALAPVVVALAPVVAAGVGLYLIWKVFIDPSGTVVDTHGNPIGGATATLLEQSLAGSPFTPVEPSSGAIEPAENPETTKASGQFDWNALAGTYEVQASAPGCHAPGDPEQASVFTSPFEIPPPAVGLMLTLECPAAPAPTPRLASLSASGGATAGGNVVDISGEGLADVTAVHFGPNASVHVQPLSPYAVAAVAPAGSGTVDVTVSGPGGTSTMGAADRYTYSTPVVTASSPVIESVAPNSGPLSGGTTVTIKGTHLGGVFAVQFGETVATQVAAQSESEVQAVAPAGAFPERVDVTVTTSTGSSAPTLADTFTYGSPPPPVATNMTLTPSEGTVAHGQTLTLKATVAPTDGGGSVAFYADGSTTALGNCAAQAPTLTGGAYEATCSTSSLALGSHSLSASYTGDASYARSSGGSNVSVTHSPEEEAKEKAEREAKEKAEREAKEEAEREAEEKTEREQHEREARTKAEGEAEGKAAREATAKAAREAKENAEREQHEPKPQTSLTRAERLAKALKACRKFKNEAEQDACETRAQRKYGSKPKAKSRRGRRRK